MSHRASRRFPGTLGIALTALTCLLATARAEDVRVFIYNTGDLHEFTANLPRIAAFVKQRRQEEPNTLLVDAGDILNRGDIEVRLTRGDAMIELMTLTGYDAGILGNHDLSFGSQRTARLIDRYGYPLTEANAVWPERVRPVTAKPYRVFPLQGVRVAVIGTSSEHMNHRCDREVGRRSVPDVVKPLLREVRQHADIVVLLTHVGSARDRDLAKFLPARPADPAEPRGPDVIIGAHDHSAYRETVFDEASGTLLMHAGDLGRFVGETALTWDGERITGRTTRLIPITADMPADPGVAAARDARIARVGADRVVVKAETNLAREAVADRVARLALDRMEGDVFIAPADLIERPLLMGSITLRDLLALVPRKSVLRFSARPEAVAAWVAASAQGKNPLRLVRAPGSEDKALWTVLYPAVYADELVEPDTVPADLSGAPPERPAGRDLWDIVAAEFGDGRQTGAEPVSWHGGQPVPEPHANSGER